MEILSRIIGRMVEGDYLVGLMVEGGNRRFSEIYLLFSDDTIILCEANPLHTGYMWCVLCFEAVSGLRVGLSKSEIVLVDNVNDVSRLASLLGCKVGCLPITYLGLPLGSFKAREV